MTPATHVYIGEVKSVKLIDAIPNEGNLRRGYQWECSCGATSGSPFFHWTYRNECECSLDRHLLSHRTSLPITPAPEPNDPNPFMLTNRDTEPQGIYRGDIVECTRGTWKGRQGAVTGFPLTTRTKVNVRFESQRLATPVEVSTLALISRRPSLSIPNANPNDDTRDDVQQDVPVDEGSPEHALHDAEIVRTCMESRWMLFNNHELEYLYYSLIHRARSDNALLHPMSIALRQEMDRREMPRNKGVE